MSERLRDRLHLEAFRWTRWHTAEVVVGLAFGVLLAALWGR